MGLMRLPFEVQTRAHCGELRYWLTLHDAFIYAQANNGVWKISFPAGSGERCRLIKKGNDWVYENIMEEALKEMSRLDFRK